MNYQEQIFEFIKTTIFTLFFDIQVLNRYNRCNTTYIKITNIYSLILKNMHYIDN